MKSINLIPIEKLLDIFDKFPEMDEEIRAYITNYIKEEYKNPFELNRFKFKDIRIEENRNTLYNGLRCSIDLEKTFTFIIGMNNTGKTYSFDKIFHFFSDYSKKVSNISKLLTELSFNIIDIDRNIEFSIKYHSQDGFQGNKFIIEKHILDKSGLVKKTEIISDPEDFLKCKLLIDYDLNETMFLPESPGESFVTKYCSEENNFKKLFRIPIVNKILIKVSEFLNQYENEFNKKTNFLEAYNNDLQRKENLINRLIKDKEIDNDYIINEKDYLKSIEAVDKISNELKEKEENELQNYRSNKVELARKKEILRKLNELDDVQIKDKFDALYQKLPQYCFECDSIILPKIFKDRVKEGTCYICGIGEKNYELEFDILPKSNFEELLEERKKIKEEIKNIKDDISNYLKKKSDIIKKPSGISEKIWVKVLHIPNITEEITRAKTHIDEYDLQIAALRERIDINENKIFKIKEKMEGLKLKKKSLIKIRDEIFLIEKKNFEDLKKKVLEIVNRILMTLTVEDIGSLDYDENGDLIFLNSYYKDLKKKEYDNKVYNYRNSKKKLSSGTLRKIDLAFCLAFLFINRQTLIRPLNAIFIDGFNYLEAKDIEMLLKDLGQEMDYQIIIFNTEEPEKLNAKNSKIIQILRNPLMRRPDNIKSLKKPTSLVDFL